MKDTKKILFISYHFYPGNAVGARRPTEFVKSLHDEGFSVDVITLNRGKSESVEYIDRIYLVNNYSDPINVIAKAVRGIKQILSRNVINSKTRKIKKTYNQMSEQEKEDRELTQELLSSKARRYVLSFQASFSAKKIWITLGVAKLIYLKLQRKKYQIVVTSSPPVAVNILGLVAKYLFSAKWILDLRDPINQWDDVYPECISAARVRLEEALEKLCLNESDLIFVTTPSYKSELEELANYHKNIAPVTLLYNGYDSRLIGVNDKIKANNSLNIVYAGSIYMNRDPFPFLRAIKKLIVEDKKDISVNFYGDCGTWKGIDIKVWLKVNGIDAQVVLHGNVASDKLDQIYQEANVLLVFAQGQAKQIPAKIFEYLVYSAAILTVTEKNSDSADLLSGIQSAYVVESCEEKIQEAILSIEKNRMIGKDVDEIKFFSRECQNKSLIKACNNFNNAC